MAERAPVFFFARGRKRFGGGKINRARGSGGGAWSCSQHTHTHTHNIRTLSRWRTTTGSDTTMNAFGPNSSLNTPPLSINLW